MAGYGYPKTSKPPAVAIDWRDIIAVAALIVLDVLLYWQFFFLGEFVPRGGGDLVSFIYPRYAFVARFAHQRVLPLWDPYLFGGQPYLADVQSGLLYPINLAAFALVRSFDYHKLEILAIGHYALAGIFAYALGRQLRLGRCGAFVAGIVWEGSGVLVAHLGHYNLVAVAVWIPLILALLQPALAGGSVLWCAAAAVALATSTLAGHTQLSLYVGLLLLIYAAGYALAVRSWLAPLRSLAVVAGWSVLMCLVQLWPSFELTRLSVRADLTYEDAVAFSLLPQKLVLFLIPHYYGRTPDSYWGPPSLTENYLYVGILPLALAALALVATRDWRARVFAVVAALGLLLSFADWTPLHGWLFVFGPGFDKVRAPGRFLVYVDFGLAMLAGIGADVLARPLARRLVPSYKLLLTGWAVFAFGMVVFAAPLVYIRLFLNRAQTESAVQQMQTATNSFALSTLFILATLALLIAYRYRWVRGWSAAAVAVALIVVDLYGNNGALNPTTIDPTSGFQHLAVNSYLDQNLGSERIDTVTGVEDVWQPDASALYGYRSVWGVYDPLTILDYYWFWKVHVPGRSSRLYDLLGPKYVLAHKDVVLDFNKFKRIPTDDPQIDLFENTQALPRSFWVGGATIAPSHDAALETIKAKDFDPGRTVVLEAAEAAGLPTGAPVGPVAGNLANDGPNTVVVDVDAPGPGYLILADAYYPGWDSTLDGKTTSLLRADWVFRAVQVSSGHHQVEFRFRPRSLVVGGGISAVAWITAIMAIAVGVVRDVRRKNAKKEV
jgi:hypothetical protein